MSDPSGALETALSQVPLACPLDGLPLALRDKSLVCSNGHCHDIAKQGYVNLLPVQFKRSSAPGDDASMVAARQRVFDAGVYEPVAEAVIAEVVALAAGAAALEPDAESTSPAADVMRRELTIIDAGCGEGYYTARLDRALAAGVGRHRARVLGTDISQPAIRAAARRHRSIAWAVANNTHLPVVGGRADLIVSLFGFETWEAWAHLQVDGQLVVVVDAGRRHLIELREAIYPEVRLHDVPDDAAVISAGYELINTVIHGSVTGALDGPVLQDVFAMTPHAYRTSQPGHDAVRSLTRLCLTLDVCIRVYRLVARSRHGATDRADSTH